MIATSMKAALATLLATCLVPTLAAADPAGVEVHSGLGFEAMTTEQGNFGERTTTHTIVGVGPVGGIGWIKRTHRKRGWQFRFGPELIASVVGDHNERGVTLGAVMKVGFHFHWLSGELGYGLSSMSFKAADLDARSPALMAHYAAGIDLSRNWALRGKIDAHATGMSNFGAVILGAGLVYRP